MKFRGDNVCKLMLIADNGRETGKIKIQQNTESVWMVGQGYFLRKR